jgi:hypothetical protein
MGNKVGKDDDNVIDEGHMNEANMVIGLIHGSGRACFDGDAGYPIFLVRSHVQLSF